MCLLVSNLIFCVGRFVNWANAFATLARVQVGVSQRSHKLIQTQPLRVVTVFINLSTVFILTRVAVKVLVKLYYFKTPALGFIRLYDFLKENCEY